MNSRFGSMVFLLALRAAGGVSAAEDILIDDFERSDYGSWTVEGDAFGSEPATGTLPGQQRVAGYLGERLVNSFLGGDASTGTLTSASFVIERSYINFLIGGGGYAGMVE